MASVTVAATTSGERRLHITEAWLVDLPAGLVVVHREPVGGEYEDVRQARPGELLGPLAFADASFDVAVSLP